MKQHHLPPPQQPPPPMPAPDYDTATAGSIYSVKGGHGRGIYDVSLYPPGPPTQVRLRATLKH